MLQVIKFTAIYCIVMTPREQRLITREHIATHTNLFLWFNLLNSQGILVIKPGILTVTLQASLFVANFHDAHDMYAHF